MFSVSKKRFPVSVTSRNGSATVSACLVLAAASWLCLSTGQFRVFQTASICFPENGLAGICKWAILCILAFLSVFDMKEHLIPNRCIFAGIGIWEFAGILRPGYYCRIHTGWDPHLAGAGLLAAGVWGISRIAGSLLQRPGHRFLGGGDIKLLFLAGLFLGFPRTLYMLFLACLLGLGMGIRVNRNGKRVFPFGPALAFAFAVFLLR